MSDKLSRSLVSNLDMQNFCENLVEFNDEMAWDNPMSQRISVVGDISLKIGNSCEIFVEDTVEARSVLREKLCENVGYTIVETLLKELGITNEDLLAIFKDRDKRIKGYEEQ